MRDRVAIAALSSLCAASALGLWWSTARPAPALDAAGSAAPARPAPALPWEALAASDGSPAAEPTAAAAPAALPVAPAPEPTRPDATASPTRERIAALGARGADAAAHLAELVAALVADDGVVRLRAAEVLAGLGPAGMRALLGALRDDRIEPRLAAAFALARTLDRLAGPELDADAALLASVLSGWLVQDDPGLRADGAEALGRLGARARGALPALLAALGDDDEQVRAMATRALGRVGGGAEVAAALAGRLEDGQAAVRHEAIAALAALGPDADAATGALVAALAGADPDVRGDIAEALGRIGARTPTATDALLAMLDGADEPEDARAAAARALGALGVVAARERLAALTGRDPPVGPLCAAAVAGLCTMGPLTDAERERMAALAATGDLDVRMAAAEALGRAGASTAGGALRLAARDPRAPVRAAALEAISRAGEPAADAIPVLAAGLHDADVAVREAAATGLARRGPEAAVALIPSLLDDDWRVHSPLWQLFADRREGLAPAVESLVGLFAHERPAVRRRAARVAGSLGGAGAPAVPALVRALGDREVRDEAVRALSWLGPVAAPALPALDALARRLEAQEGSGKPVAGAAGWQLQGAARLRFEVEHALARIRPAGDR